MALVHTIVEGANAPVTACTCKLPAGSFVRLTPEQAAERDGQCDLVMAPTAEGSELAFRGDKALKPEEALDWAVRLEAEHGIPGPWRF